MRHPINHYICMIKRNKIALKNQKCILINVLYGTILYLKSELTNLIILSFKTNYGEKRKNRWKTPNFIIHPCQNDNNNDDDNFDIKVSSQILQNFVHIYKKKNLSTDSRATTFNRISHGFPLNKKIIIFFLLSGCWWLLDSSFSNCGYI